MTSLEDKLLGEKREYYCSSESEEENESGDDGEVKESVKESVNALEPPPPSDPGGSTNTGPKGVIKDWQKYRQLEVEKREEQERERIELIKKLSMTCRSALDDERAEDPDLDELLSDDFLLQYSKQRMEEMLNKASNLPKFGQLTQLDTPDSFVEAIDKEQKEVTVIIHIYEDKVEICRNMNACLKELSIEHPNVKFCNIRASVAGVSKQFKIRGVPALLVYKGGNLVGNYIKLGEEFGIEFTSGDVENFLIENGMLRDKSCVPSIIKCSNLSDSGDELD